MTLDRGEATSTWVCDAASQRRRALVVLLDQVSVGLSDSFSVAASGTWRKIDACALSLRCGTLLMYEQLGGLSGEAKFEMRDAGWGNCFG